MEQQMEGLDLTQRDYQDAARLGAPFKIVDGDVSPFRLKVAKRIEATLMIFVGVSPFREPWVSRRFFLSTDRRMSARWRVGLRNFAVRVVAWCLLGPQR
jgi:hypothetical protein